MVLNRTSVGELDRLRILIEDSTDMLSRHTPAGVYLYVSPACRELLGYEPEELIGRSAYDFFHPDDLARIRASHDGVLEAPGLSTIEYRIRHADGSYRWFETTSHGIVDVEIGRIVEIQTSSRDVTARKETELRLADSERRFRLAMEHAPIGKAIVGLDGAFLEVNPRLCAIVGRTAEELQALGFQDITSPEDLDADLELAGQLLSGEIDSYVLEKRYVHGDGHPVWVRLAGSVVRDDRGAPQYFIAQIEDISLRKDREAELQRLNAELAASNAELERFGAVASHDLRSPLATLQGMLDLVVFRFGDGLDDDVRDLIDRARRHAERLRGTVEGLLQLAKVGQVASEVRRVDVAATLDEVLADLAPEIDAVGADVRVGVLPDIDADPAQLRVLLQNLVANALKYHDPDRPLVVRVRGERVDGHVAVAVEDNGRGFDPDDREVMFQPFGRTKTGEKLEGAGIGLATCRRIVERHGGTIEAEPLDRGARFTFTLPTDPGPGGDVA